MKIELKEPKKNKISFIEKKFVLKKEKGENLLYIGTTSSGKHENILSFIHELYKQKNIDKYIYINTKGDLNSFIISSTIMKKFDKNFSFFNLLKLNNNDFGFFENIDFKNETIQKELNKKNLLFLFPYLEKLPSHLKEKAKEKITSFLVNLPENKNNKEIPVFIEGIEIIKENDLATFEKIIKIINNKGYFLIAGIADYSCSDIENLTNFLKINFKHTFLMKTEIQGITYLEDYFSLYKTKVQHLDPGEYYYLENLKVNDLKKRKMPYNLNELDIKVVNNYIEITEEYIEKKLKIVDKIKKF